MVASAAPVTMFVAPGPTEDVHATSRADCLAGVARRRRGPSPARCGPGGSAAVGVCCSAWPMPGHVAVPEDAEAAREEAAARAPSRSRTWAARKRNERLGDREPHATSSSTRRWSASRPRRRAARRRARRRVGQRDRRAQAQPREQPVAQRAAERVAGAEPVDDLDAHRRRPRRLARAVAREHALGPALDDRQRDAQLEQRVGRRARLARADRDRRPRRGCRRRRSRGGAPRAPSGRASDSSDQNIGRWSRSWTVIAPARSRRGPRARPASPSGSARPTGRCRSSRRCRASRIAARSRSSTRRAHVRRLRLAVEEQREVVGREDLAEDDRRAQRRVGADPARVDAEVLERLAHVRAERVVADLGDDRGARAEPRRRDGDVGRAAAERLRERLHVGEPDADLLRVEVHPHPPHRDQVEAHAPTSIGRGPRVLP